MIKIWAPHPDDEIIGCFYVLQSQKVQVCYGVIEDGCAKSAELFGFQYYRLAEVSIKTSDIVYAPDPRVDFHPEHQKVGNLALSLFRVGKINRLIFYTTSMLAPYIWEVPAPEAKRDALDKCYPEKSDLWKFEHKWFLFEGYWEMLRLGH